MLPPKVVQSVSILLAAALGVGIVLLFVNHASGDADYGLGLFFVLPVFVGAVTGVGTAFAGKEQPHDTLWPSMAAGFLVAFGLLAFGIEGAICLLMASPIMLLPVWVGALLGWEIVRRLPISRVGPPAIFVLMLVALAGYDEGFHRDRAAQAEYTSGVVVNAPPSVVWDRIVHLGRLPDGPNWMKSLGLACPESTVLKGRKLGAIRECTLTTGPMREKVTTWVPEHRLGFVALTQPPPMQETNPFADVHPAHLNEHYYKVLYGEFRIEDLGGGRCWLERTTRYEHRLRPALYWTTLMNIGAAKAHSMVLDYVKLESEAQATRPMVASRTEVGR